MLLRDLNAVMRSRRGFTLLELLVVMVIIVLLASVVSLVVIKRVEEARHAKAVADIDTMESALDQFYVHCNRYPTTDEGTAALKVKPANEDLQNWNGPYVKKAIPADPWGREYMYECPGQNNIESFDLSTLGRDGKEGGTGSDADVANWD